MPNSDDEELPNESPKLIRTVGHRFPYGINNDVLSTHFGAQSQDRSNNQYRRTDESKTPEQDGGIYRKSKSKKRKSKSKSKKRKSKSKKRKSKSMKSKSRKSKKRT